VFQQSFTDLGTPLQQVAFCVLDLETTGGRRGEDMITEIGAVKIAGGQVLGSYQTLINPGRPISTGISYLTGITTAMVENAPRIETVLPSFLEFLGNSVIVGHNVQFDLGFLNAALERVNYPKPNNKVVDTLALARRLVRDEVPNCKLSTLSRCMNLPKRTAHRALEDALTTSDLLHVLLEKAASLGVLGLDDLLELPKLHRHPQAGKLSLTTNLPRKPGVYQFLNAKREVLYIGKATNLRSRVRSYFSSDPRKKVTQLLKETKFIECTVCELPLKAEVLEVQLIHRHQPRFNRQAANWNKYVYLKLTTNERFPRLTVVSQTLDDNAFYLGPISSRRIARLAASAIESAIPLRRCTKKISANPTDTRCTSIQIGSNACPCTGAVKEIAYQPIVESALQALTDKPELVLLPLKNRMRSLALERRFEEATKVRDQAAALSGLLQRQRKIDSLRSAGRIIVEIPGWGRAEIQNGFLVNVLDGPEPRSNFTNEPNKAAEIVKKEDADELWCVSRWVNSQSSKLKIIYCDLPLASKFPGLQSFDPTIGAESRLETL
jgi:DNA polymerase-3 subunit epsilon